jgi:hypothetical protein
MEQRFLEHELHTGRDITMPLGELVLGSAIRSEQRQQTR